MPATPTPTRATPSQKKATPTQKKATPTQKKATPTQTVSLKRTDPTGGECPPPRKQALTRLTPIGNRVSVLLVHIPRLSIRGQARLAAEVGVSRSTISRLVGGRINPSYRLARGVTTALERMLGRPLDMREVFTTDGTYPTRSGCALCGCGGCLPDAAYDGEGSLRPEWRGAHPGDWSLSPPF